MQRVKHALIDDPNNIGHRVKLDANLVTEDRVIVMPDKNIVLDNLYVHPNHSGDVTSVGDGAQTIADDAVTYAKIQDVSATNRFLGRDTAGAGVVEELTAAAARTILNVADGAAVGDFLADGTVSMTGALAMGTQNITNAALIVAVAISIGAGDFFVGSDLSARVSIDGGANEVQLQVQADLNQTADIFVVEKSDGTDLLTIDNAGLVTITGKLTVDTFTLDGGILSTSGTMIVQAGVGGLLKFNANGANLEMTLKTDELVFNNGANVTAIGWATNRHLDFRVDSIVRMFVDENGLDVVNTVRTEGVIIDGAITGLAGTITLTNVADDTQTGGPSTATLAPFAAKGEVGPPSGSTWGWREDYDGTTKIWTPAMKGSGTW